MRQNLRQSRQRSRRFLLITVTSKWMLFKVLILPKLLLEKAVQQSFVENPANLVFILFLTLLVEEELLMNSERL